MKPTFKISSKDKLYIDDKYISNGHWLVVKPISDILALKNLNYKNGTYIKGVFQCETVPNMEKVVTNIKLDEYHKVSNFSTICASTFEVLYYNFEDVIIDSKYILLCTLGDVYIKNNLSPVVIIKNDEIKAIIMPARIKK